MRLSLGLGIQIHGSPDSAPPAESVFDRAVYAHRRDQYSEHDAKKAIDDSR